MACAPREDSCQFWVPLRLIRVIALRLTGRQGYNIVDMERLEMLQYVTNAPECPLN